MASVGLDVSAKGGHLVERALFVQHADRSELDADRNRASLAKDVAHLVWGGRGREVPVKMRMAEHGVSHRSANAPCLEATLFEASGDSEHGRGRIQPGHAGGV